MKREQHNKQVTSQQTNVGRFSAAKLSALLLAFACVFGSGSARASDPIGVFARIDKVVLEPAEGTPERIQLWGAFCLANEKDRDSYHPPQKGFLYYKLPDAKAEAARKEWNDLKKSAGTGEVIGFGARRATAVAKVRDASAKPENPDPYPLGFGLVKSRDRGTSYPPIKALMEEKAAALEKSDTTSVAKK